MTVPRKMHNSSKEGSCGGYLSRSAPIYMVGQTHHALFFVEMFTQHYRRDLHTKRTGDCCCLQESSSEASTSSAAEDAADAVRTEVPCLHLLMSDGANASSSCYELHCFTQRLLQALMP